MEINIVILILLGALFYYSEKVKDEKKRNVDIQKKKDLERYLLESKLDLMEKEKNVNILVARIKDNLKSLMNKNVICNEKIRQKKINRYTNLNRGDSYIVEEDYFENIINFIIKAKYIKIK